MSKKRSETALSRPAAAAFEVAVGGREALSEVLSTSARDSKQDILYRLLCDPARQRDSLAKICQDAGVSATEVLSMYRDAKVAESMVAAQVTLAERLEGIARDVAERALDHVRPCRCRVLSASDTPLEDCTLCGGRGEVFLEGSLDHAKLATRLAGLDKGSGGGVNVNVRQQVGVALGGGFLDSFVKATDTAAFDIGPAAAASIEGEVIEVGGEADGS